MPIEDLRGEVQAEEARVASNAVPSCASTAHTCSGCGQHCDSQNQLEHHMATADHRWRCAECSRSCGSYAGLLQHHRDTQHFGILQEGGLAAEASGFRPRFTRPRRRSGARFAPGTQRSSSCGVQCGVANSRQDDDHDDLSERSPLTPRFEVQRICRAQLDSPVRPAMTSSTEYFQMSPARGEPVGLVDPNSQAMWRCCSCLPVSEFESEAELSVHMQRMGHTKYSHTCVQMPATTPPARQRRRRPGVCLETPECTGRLWRGGRRSNGGRPHAPGPVMEEKVEASAFRHAAPAVDWALIPQCLSL